MKLRSLSMRLFRQHVESTVNVPDGLVGIIGANGSGKTTILEAVGFALFGSRALRGRTEDVRTRTAPGKVARSRRDSDPHVELVIEHETTVFRIERSLSDAALYVAGEARPVAEGNREVSSRIAALIGMSYEEFVATYCTEQKGLEFLSGKKGATEREKFIIRILGYDRLEELQELLRSDRKEKRAILQGFEASIGTREELESRILSEEKRCNDAREKHGEALKALTTSETEFNALHSKMQKLEDVRSRYAREREASQALEVRLEERVKRLKALSDAAIVADDELRRALKPIAGTRSVDEVSREVKREILQIKDRIEALSQQLQNLEFSAREEVSKIHAEREGLIRQADALAKKVRKVESLETGGECPTCSQPLGETFESVHAHLIKERDALVSKADELRAELEQRATPSQALVDTRVALGEARAASDRLHNKLQELGVCEQLERKRGAIAEDQRVVEVEIKSARENVERAQVRLREYNFSEEAYQREKGAHDAAQRLVEVTRLQRVRLEGELNTQMALLARAREDLEKFDERQSEVARIRHEARLYDECDRLVTDFRKFVNASIRPRMAELASEYLTDLTDGRYSAVELGEDFTPTVIEDGEAKRVISGGEEDILNLCMRIALSHMLAERAGQNFSLLMLDEVFGSLDEGRRSNVLSLLEKLRRRFEQIVIITHLDDIKDGVQHLIQVEYDDGEGSARVIDSGDVFFDFAEAMNV